ncbi:MAG: hypothetical protein ACN2B6_01185 [Rickettsiales bacterium]
MNYYKFTYKDGSVMGYIAESRGDAFDVAHKAPGQNESTVASVQVKEFGEWLSLPIRDAVRRKDDDS